VKVLFDTNVVLDVLLAREPHFEVAARLFSLVDNKAIDGLICATTVTTIHYLAAKAVGAKKAATHVRALMALFEVAPVSRAVLAGAMERGFDDFEDALLHEAALLSGATAIVTRNGKDFAKAALPVFEPVALLAAVASTR
jgi:predicted nucleic acid-binding protein